MRQDKQAEQCVKDVDAAWWEGFDAAIELVINNIFNGGFFESEEIANMFADEIIDDVELYKADG